MTSHDRSDELRRLLDSGADLDQALTTQRTAGASWIECIASLQTVRGCGLAEAKRLVQTSPAWADVMNLEGWAPAHPSDTEDAEALNEKRRRVALLLIQGATIRDREALLQWARDLLEIRSDSGPALSKASRALRRTLRDSVVSIPKLQAVEPELGVSAMEIPIWITVGAGEPFAAALVEELSR